MEDGFLDVCEEYTDADTYYQYCTAFPVGTALAQTWDTELMQQLRMVYRKTADAG